MGVALCGLAACAPDLGPLPVEKAPEAYAVQKSFDVTPTDWPAENWWAAYGDAQLDTLIAEGLADAPDLKRAEARLRQADALAQQAGVSRYPNITANSSFTETRNSLNQGFPAAFQSFLPHGYHDRQVIRDQLEAAGFAAITTETLQRTSRAGSAREVAMAYCQGTPLRSEIEARSSPGLDAVTETVAEALARRFGTGSIEGRIGAHVVSAER